MRRALVPRLFDDDPTAAEASRSSPVMPARSSSATRAKAGRKRTPDGLPVQSFRTLLADLATLTATGFCPWQREPWPPMSSPSLPRSRPKPSASSTFVRELYPVRYTQIPPMSQHHSHLLAHKMSKFGLSWFWIRTKTAGSFTVIQTDPTDLRDLSDTHPDRAGEHTVAAWVDKAGVVDQEHGRLTFPVLFLHYRCKLDLHP